MKSSKNWFIAGLVVTLAICVFFLLQPDKQHDTHKSDQAEVIAINDTLKAHDAVSARVIDSLSKAIAQKDSANKSLIKGQANTERKLNAKTAELNQYIEQIREINTDTGVFGRMLDSLKVKAESLTFLLVQYEAYADSINNVNDSLRIGYEAMIKEKDKRYAELKAAYDNLLKAYQELFSTTQGLQKSLRRQKLKTKVAAVLGAAGAVLLLVK
jgi:chromosome segregation ATPase